MEEHGVQGEESKARASADGAIAALDRLDAHYAEQFRRFGTKVDQIVADRRRAAGNRGGC